VRNNLTLWDGSVPQETITQAAKDAAVHDVIAERPHAYDGRVDEGGRNFSGGEAQRLEIARALVTEPSILVLDEATSALDPATEAFVFDSLRRRGCSCIVIAHRLSTIRDCDEIIVLDRGKVVERGRHAELIDVDGPYARLVATL
jgi:ABC-type multidrug transport system fused ATPase/permease subunit